MSFFLLKPHVVGPENNITSPDVIVDRLFIDGTLAPLNRLTHEIWQQVATSETAHAAYGLMALGGGVLILPTIVLGSGTVVAARKAWRLNNLDGHIGKVTLNGTAIAENGLPSTHIESAGISDDTLPRGYLLVHTAGAAQSVELADPVLGRSLTHRVVFEPTKKDRWGDARPIPRYSIGPTQKEIPHFI
jgi:hypothetical protein